jgi:hypothetical protein
MTTLFSCRFVRVQPPLPTSADTKTEALSHSCFTIQQFVAKYEKVRRRRRGEGEALHDDFTVNSKCSLSIFPAESYSYVKILFLE